MRGLQAPLPKLLQVWCNIDIICTPSAVLMLREQHFGHHYRHETCIVGSDVLQRLLCELASILQFDNRNLHVGGDLLPQLPGREGSVERQRIHKGCGQHACPQSPWRGESSNFRQILRPHRDWVCHGCCIQYGSKQEHVKRISVPLPTVG